MVDLGRLREKGTPSFLERLQASAYRSEVRSRRGHPDENRRLMTLLQEDRRQFGDLPLQGETVRSAPGETLELADWQRFPSRFVEAMRSIEERQGLWVSAFVVAFVAELISIFLASTMTGYYSARFIGLSADPFAKGIVPISYPEHRLRLLGPLLAWLLGLKGGLGTFVAPAFNVPLLMVVYRTLRERVSLELTVAATLLMATTQVTMTSRTLLGYHDSMVFFFLLLAMVSRSLLGSLLAFALALLGDPRAVLCLPILGIWQSLEARQSTKAAAIRVAALGLLTLAFVLFSRWMLHWLEYEDQLNARVGTYFDGRYLKDIDFFYLPISAFMAFKAGWLLVGAPVWISLGRRPWLALALAGNLLAIVGAGLLVHDVSRALAFAFPFALLGVIQLQRLAPRFALAFVSTCYLVNVCTPFHQGWSWGLWIQSAPLPWVVGKSLWDG